MEDIKIPEFYFEIGYEDIEDFEDETNDNKYPEEIPFE